MATLLPQTGKAFADAEGRNGVWFAKQGLDVVSVDFSPAAQAKARARAAEHDVNITFIEADIHAWPIRSRRSTWLRRSSRNSASLPNANANGRARDAR